MTGTMVRERPDAFLPGIRDDDREKRRDEFRALRLALLWKTAPRMLRRILRHLDSGALPFPWTAADLARLSDRWGTHRPEDLLLPGAEQAARVACCMESLGISLLERGRAPFPAELENIPDPPPFLFVRGEPLDGGPARRVAIVGSRAASTAGREIAYSLARDLALSGCTIVSGMARGIDAEAHLGALEAGGRTIAVLGTGADLCYPPEHATLFSRILARGGVVTEFPPGTPARGLHFPRRNRILAGLSSVLVVVEGGERSGARSTVDHALEQGLDVLAVPRDIVLPGSILPNRLVRDGARPVLSARDVLETLGELAERQGRQAASAGDVSSAPASALKAPAEPIASVPGAAGSGAPASAPGQGREALLLHAIRERARRLEDCLTLLPGETAGSAQALLLKLEIMGWIERRPGGRWEAR